MRRLMGILHQINPDIPDFDSKRIENADEEGKEVELTSSNYSKFIESDDRRVREDAFKKYHTVYGNFRNTLSSTYYQTVKLDEITSNLRKYKNSF